MDLLPELLKIVFLLITNTLLALFSFCNRI